MNEILTPWPSQTEYPLSPAVVDALLQWEDYRSELHLTCETGGWAATTGPTPDMHSFPDQPDDP